MTLKNSNKHTVQEEGEEKSKDLIITELLMMQHSY